MGGWSVRRSKTASDAGKSRADQKAKVDRPRMRADETRRRPIADDQLTDDFFGRRSTRMAICDGNSKRLTL